MLRRPYTCLPPVKYRDYCQLAPTNLQEWLQERRRSLPFCITRMQGIPAIAIW